MTGVVLLVLAAVDLSHRHISETAEVEEETKEAADPKEEAAEVGAVPTTEEGPRLQGKEFVHHTRQVLQNGRMTWFKFLVS